MNGLSTRRHLRLAAALAVMVLATTLARTVPSGAEAAGAGSQVAGSQVAGSQVAGSQEQPIQPTAAGKSGRAERVVPKGHVQPTRPAFIPTHYKSRAALEAKTVAPTSGAVKRGGEASDEAAGLPKAPPSVVGLNFNGISQAAACGGCFPPDTHGAVGLSHYVQIVNTRFVVYSKSTAAVLKSVSLASFFGTTEFVFDPRIIYDRTWNRWVVVATRRAASTTDTARRYFLAVSVTGDPSGAFYRYQPTFGGGVFQNGDWLDFPQLGMDQDAIIITGNYFHRTGTTTNSFRTTGAHSIPKARIYNGWGFSHPIFTGLNFSVAPPILSGFPTDQSHRTFLVSANADIDRLFLYRMENTEKPSATTLVTQAAIPAVFAPPPTAAQPGTTRRLDTLDGRFQNASSQYGNFLWNIHTINVSGFPTPHYYQIDTTTNAIVRQGHVFRTSTSHDFNPAIGVNTGNEVFVVWSATDPPAGAAGRVQIRTSGCQVAAGDCDGQLGPGSLRFLSPASYTGGCILNASGVCTNVSRWGDYSAVSLDPSAVTGCSAGRRAWVTNEKVDVATSWSSRITRIGFC